MGAKGRCAVRTEDAQVLEPVVVADAVDVVEDQGQLCAAPDFALSAELASSILQPFLVQALLEIGAAVRGVLDEDVFEGQFLSTPEAPVTGMRVEVVDRDSPDRNPLPQHPPRPAGGTEAEPAKRLCV
jgi:hypothetical protein